MFLMNDRDITIGPVDVTVYSPDLGGCYGVGCLSVCRFSYSRSMRSIICNILDGISDIRPMQPGMNVSLSAKELSAVNFALASSTTTAIQTSTNIDTTAGNFTSSTVADPAEWHVVRLGAGSTAGPWTFTLTANNRDLFYATTTFVLNTDVSIFTAANTNGDTAVSPLAASLAYNTDGVTANTFWVSDACLGKLSFTAIPDSSIVQWNYDSSAQPFTINGVYPKIESNVRNGDTVGLIGLGYKWGSVQDSTGAEVAKINRQKVQIDNLAPQPVSLKLVHQFEKDRLHKQLIIRVWKAMNMSGFGMGFDSQSATDIGLDMTFTGLNDGYNHPLTPFGEIEIINSANTVNLPTNHV